MDKFTSSLPDKPDEKEMPAVMLALVSTARVSNLTQTTHNQAILDSVMRKRAVHRIVNFSSSIMHVLNPRMYEMYEYTLTKLCDRDPSLCRNFPGNPFAAATFNVGQHAVAYGHTDHLNVPNGWCTITAIGKFDSARGGHLILWNLKLVIEFPTGSTILIPSALLKHSNTHLHDPENEFQYSFVQYSAGGLFQWSAGRHFLQTGKERWERGMKVFSKWAKLFPGR
ncbi:hypothetical protein LXA43DRAFT_976615 [Ganoderma leucocontextum]|nr:hypothetical protein LXA43DRAFT_976615 [Ganoderma leucocontextum]